MKFTLSTKILISSLACLLLGSLSGIATASAVSGWYALVIKPAWNPPNWLFAPVWSLLYLMMGAAFALVWHEKGKNNKMALVLFVVQFILNLFWSVLFFALARMDLALIEILVLWVFIFLSIFSFYKVNLTAAYLLVPYLLWVSFASVLNANLVFLNA
jgi:benzodiazapine receptor